PPGAAHPPGGVGAALGAGPADGHGPLPGVEDGPRREPLGPVAHRLDDHLAPDAVRLDDAADLQAACGRLERLRGAPGTAAFLFRQSKPRFARCSVGQSTMSRLARTPSLVPAAATTWRRAWATRPRRPITLPMSDGDTWRRSSTSPRRSEVSTKTPSGSSTMLRATYSSTPLGTPPTIRLPSAP